MASPWRSLASRALRIAVREGPRVLREARGARGRAGSGGEGRLQTGPAKAARSAPTGEQAGRTVGYAPDLDGRADPGEIVWTWVPYEEDASRGKDRPVLVVGRDDQSLLGLMLSSQSDHDGEPGWLGIGTGGWDREGRPSWVRLDRVLEMTEDGIRREGAVLDQSRFEPVADALRRDHGWT